MILKIEILNGFGFADSGGMICLQSIVDRALRPGEKVTQKDNATVFTNRIALIESGCERWLI